MGEVTVATAIRVKRRNAALKAWDKRGRKKPAGPGVSRGDWRQGEAMAIERELASGQIVDIAPQGGGISETYKVKLANGKEALFKVNSEEGVAAERGVWEVAKLIGMDDMVPPAVEREVNAPGRRGDPNHPAWGAGTKKGSLALWQQGTPASRVPKAERYDGDVDLQRAAMFDFITGNIDRHSGNWVVDNGKIRLIDHNLAFGHFPASEFLRHIRGGALMGPQNPYEYARRYVEKKSEIAAALRKVRVSDSNIALVLRRIDRAAAAKTWADF